MSTTIRNIKVIIDGIQSAGFNISIDGSVYRMDSFTLSQRLLNPATLSFSIHRHEAQEDSKDATFQLSGRLIGKSIKLELSTDNVEAESSINDDTEKTADVKFVGFIQNVSCSRVSTGYTLYVSAASWEAVLDSHPDCFAFNDKTLKEIIERIVSDNISANVPGFKMHIDTEYIDKIQYCVMYNESQLQFLQRLARRYSEWMYNDGEQMIFGKLPDIEPVTLEYPGRDIESFSADVSLVSHNYIMYGSSHYADTAVNYTAFKRYLDKFGDPKLSTLQKKAYDAAGNLFTRNTRQRLESGGYDEGDNDGEAMYVVQCVGQARVLQSHMVRYNGVTYSSRIKIGCRLQIKDNVVMSNEEETHSDVNQEDILIVGLTHSFSADETYRNSFEGIPGVCMYPPYPLGEVYPKSGPTRGYVCDNLDPEGLGRVRVMIGYQSMQNIKEDKLEIDSLAPYATPWIRVVQFYDTCKFVPEVGQEVLVDFEHGNAELPFVVGSYWMGFNPMDPEWTENNNDNNEVKAFRTMNGHTVEFHDVGLEKGGYVHVYDQAKKYDVLLSTDGELVRLRSAGDIQLIAKKNILLKAGEDVGVSAGANLDLNSDGDMAVCVEGIRDVTVHQDYLTVEDDLMTQTKQESHNSEFCLQTYNDKTVTLAGKAGYIAQTKLRHDSRAMLETKAITYKEESETYSAEAKTYAVDATASASIKSKVGMEIESQQVNVEGSLLMLKGNANASLSAPSVTIN